MWVDVEMEELVEAIAVGVHTGLRKGSEAPSSATLWQAISRSDDGAWSEACEWAANCFELMGWRVQRCVDES